MQKTKVATSFLKIALKKCLTDLNSCESIALEDNLESKFKGVLSAKLKDLLSNSI